ncbi:MAG TPA: MFS transporter [Burkholderiales bacterium]|nr:MFS transporter [Burkholderiales bacterium]
MTSSRTLVTVVVCGALILAISLGIRQSFGLFLQPMSADMGWGRSTFAFAIALQNLIWGVGQPGFGAVADKFGAGRVVLISGLLYVAGLALMALSTSGLSLDVSAGLLIGLGLSGTGFGVILGVVGKMAPPEKRSVAIGIVSAGGSFGQFAMIPYGQLLISSFGWQTGLLLLVLTALIVVPLSAAMVGSKKKSARGSEQSLAQAIREAGGHRGFLYLNAGFFVCGFQTAFIMVHLPSYLLDVGMTPKTGVIALALIGLFNIIGSFSAGYLGGRFSKKYLLCAIYAVRALCIGIFILLPVTTVSVAVFAMTIGLTWLGTVPLTNGLVAQIFGVRYLSTLFSIVFLSHQLGSFLGVWLGGYIFDASGSYRIIWFLTIGLSVLAALLNMPIDDRSLQRVAA